MQNTQAVLEAVDEFMVWSMNSLLAIITTYVGGSEELVKLLLVLFFLDFLISLRDAKKASGFSWNRFYLGIKKIASLFFCISMVGVGVHAIKLVYGNDVTFFGYDISFFFNLFVLLVVTLELQSINRYFARRNYPFNKVLELVLSRISSKILSLIFKFIDKIDHIEEKESNCSENDGYENNSSSSNKDDYYD